MFLSCILIRLLTFKCVQSKNKVNEEVLDNHLSTFKYEFDESQFVFFLFSFSSSSDNSQSFPNPKVNENHQKPQIEVSESLFDCSNLLKSLNITANSIVLKASNQIKSKLLYFKCTSSIQNILGYFLIDYSIDIERNKNLQDSIINFLKLSSGRNDRIKRTLQTLENFNELLINRKGCVPCAINEFDNLNLLSSEDLANIYLMLLNYNDIVLGINYQYNLNNACVINPSLQALTKLLKTDNFRQAETICQKYYDNIDNYYEKTITQTNCSNNFKDMIITHLEFFNTCFAKFIYYKINRYYFYKRYSIESLTNDFWLENFYKIYKRIVALEFEFNRLVEFNWNINTLIEENGLQIKLSYSKYDCEAIIDYNLQHCLCDSKYMYDATITLVKYSGFGDYVVRFTNNQYSYHQIKDSTFNNAYLNSYYFLRLDCFKKCDNYAPLNIYQKNGTLSNIIFIRDNPELLVTDEGIYACTNVILIYGYEIYGLNCNNSLRGCVSCLDGFTLEDNKCILKDYNCLVYGPDLRCGVCSLGYGLTKDSFCLKCSNYCKICVNNECLECESGFSLSNDKLCLPCEENCLTCTYNLCLSCKDGYTLYANIICIKCDIGCSLCDDLYLCKSCEIGYSLIEDDQNNIYCKKIKKLCSDQNCKECDENDVCTLCKTSYVLNEKFGCINTLNSNCSRIDENFNCIECRLSYYLSGNPSYCKSCIDLCHYCSNSTNCNICEPGNYFDGKTCTSCIFKCLTCIDRLNCLTCYNNLCVSETKPFICGKHPDCNKCLTDLKCRTCKHSLMIPSEIGCECIDGYFKGPYGNCLKCKKICPICKNYSGCLNCIASSSHNDQNLDCFCDKGYYKQTEKL